MVSSDKVNGTGLLDTLRSLKFGILILIIIAIVAIIGTIIPQGNPEEFYREHYGFITNSLIKVFRFDTTYRSPLFIGLLILSSINLIMCSFTRFPSIFKRTFSPDVAPSPEQLAALPVTVTLRKTAIDTVAELFDNAGFSLRKIDDNRLYGEKGRAGHLGSSIVHISLLILLVGGVVSLETGRRGVIFLENGETTDAAQLPDDSTMPLGFSLKLDRFHVEFYEKFPGRPKSFVSAVTVQQPGSPSFSKDIEVNHPLMRNGFTIYQSSYGISDTTSPASSADDTVTVSVRLKAAPAEMPPITTFDMVQGELYTIPGFGDSLRIEIAEIHRDFKRAQSVSMETNPAVKIDVYVHGNLRWSVFAFERFSGLNMPMQNDIDVLFTMVTLKKAAAIPGENTEQYYTVLGVVRDKGVPVMWFGSALMIVGLFLSFYVRPKRIWVYDNKGTILIGATTKGNAESLRKFIRNIVSESKKSAKEEIHHGSND